jgi:hypothetical protein
MAKQKKKKAKASESVIASGKFKRTSVFKTAATIIVGFFILFIFVLGSGIDMFQSLFTQEDTQTYLEIDGKELIPGEASNEVLQEMQRIDNQFLQYGFDLNDEFVINQKKTALKNIVDRIILRELSLVIFEEEGFELSRENVLDFTQKVIIEKQQELGHTLSEITLKNYIRNFEDSLPISMVLIPLQSGIVFAQDNLEQQYMAENKTAVADYVIYDYETFTLDYIQQNPIDEGLLRASYVDTIGVRKLKFANEAERVVAQEALARAMADDETGEIQSLFDLPEYQEQIESDQVHTGFPAYESLIELELGEISEPITVGTNEVVYQVISKYNKNYKKGIQALKLSFNSEEDAQSAIESTTVNEQGEEETLNVNPFEETDFAEQIQTVYIEENSPYYEALINLYQGGRSQVLTNNQGEYALFKVLSYDYKTFDELTRRDIEKLSATYIKDHKEEYKEEFKASAIENLAMIKEELENGTALDRIARMVNLQTYGTTAEVSLNPTNIQNQDEQTIQKLNASSIVESAGVTTKNLFIQVLFSLDEGQVSDIVEANDFYFVLRLKTMNEPDMAPLENPMMLAGQMQEELQTEQNQFIEDWLQYLKNKYAEEIYVDYSGLEAALGLVTQPQLPEGMDMTMFDQVTAQAEE